MGGGDGVQREVGRTGTLLGHWVEVGVGDVVEVVVWVSDLAAVASCIKYFVKLGL